MDLIDFLDKALRNRNVLLDRGYNCGRRLSLLEWHPHQFENSGLWRFLEHILQRRGRAERHVLS